MCIRDRQYIVSNLPTGVAGLLIAAIFAAAMSSVDTSLNSGATLVLCDIYKRYVHRDADEKTSMRVLYASTLFLGFVGTAVAFVMSQYSTSILDTWWKLQGAFTGGMLGLFLLGLISRRAQNAHAVLAVTVGVILILWMAWEKPLHGFMTNVFGASTIVIVGVLLCSVFSPAPKEPTTLR